MTKITRFHAAGMLAALLTLWLGGTARAADEVAPVVPFLDDSTLFVAKADLSAVDVDASSAWLAALLKAANAPQEIRDDLDKNTAKDLAPVRKWVADFTKAGGKDVYFVAVMSAQSPMFIVVPLEGSADAKALAESFKNPKPDDMSPPFGKAKSEVIGKALVVAEPERLAQVKTIDPVDRPELAKAFAGAGDGAVKAAFIPTEAVRGVLNLSMPKLPPALGGGPITVVSQGLRWAALSADVPTKEAQKAGLKITIQAKDADAATKLKSVVDAAFQSARNLPDVRNSPETGKMLDLLAVQVEGDQLRLSLDQARIQDLTVLAIPAMIKARDNARRVQSMSNMRQLLVGTIMYSSDNKGQLPQKLPDDINKYLNGMGDKLMTNPAHPERKPGYVYVRPADKVTQVRAPSGTIMLYEAFDQWGEGINVGYADGHVEFVKDEAAFKKQLQPPAPAAAE